MTSPRRLPVSARPIPVVALFALSACSGDASNAGGDVDLDTNADAGGDTSGSDVDLDAGGQPDTTGDATPDPDDGATSDTTGDATSDTDNDAASDTPSEPDAPPIDAVAIISEAFDAFARLECEGMLMCQPVVFDAYYDSIDNCVELNRRDIGRIVGSNDDPEACVAAINALRECGEVHGACESEAEGGYFEIPYYDCQTEYTGLYETCYASEEYEYEDY